MKLEGFQVKKYKRIDDSGWITLEELTGFVGKNEAGKSSLFTALAKLNSSTDLKFNKEEDIPHLEYLELSTMDDVYPITAKFNMEDDDPIENLPNQFYVKMTYDNLVNVQDIDHNSITKDVDINLLFTRMPKFIYLDEYDKLTSTFDIPEFIKQYAENKDDRKIRLQRCIFEYVKLTPELFDDLNFDKDESLTFEEKKHRMEKRNFNCISASQKMTQEFAKWWKNDYYKFEFKPDGSMFTVNISDVFDPTPVELSARSKGFQYFFSFFLIFTVEKARYHNNAILLLDEPGLYFHGTVQQNMMSFFKELAKSNQLLYTTHSPFLIDGDDYKKTKIVYNDEITGKTKVGKEGELITDENAIFPLKINWYTHQYQNYVKNKPHVIVEGETDRILFNKINEIFQTQDSSLFINSVNFIGGGGSYTMNLVSILQSTGVNMVYFNDGDKSGLSHEKKFISEFNLRGFTTKKYLERESTIEDLIPIGDLINAVNSTHQCEIDLEQIKQNKPILHQIEKQLKNNFKKLDTFNEIIKNIDKNSEILEKFKPIFFDLKKLMDKTISFKGTLRNDGKWYPNGDGFSIRIDHNNDDLDLFIPKEWRYVDLMLETNKSFRLKLESKSFGDGYREFTDSKIGKWVIENLPEWLNNNSTYPQVDVILIKDRLLKITLHANYIFDKQN